MEKMNGEAHAQVADQPAPQLEIRGLKLMQRDAPNPFQPLILSAGAMPRQEWVLVVSVGYPGNPSVDRYVMGCIQGTPAHGLGKMALAMANAIINDDMPGATAKQHPQADQARALAEDQAAGAK